MDLESLKSFYHVAKEGSFSRAAKVLHVSQPAMSVRIKTLETELGERLFDRARQGVALTEAGAVLFESAEKIFGDVEEAILTANKIFGWRVRATKNSFLNRTASTHFATPTAQVPT